MRCLLVFSCVVLWLAVASAAELKIKVVDPQSAAIAGAQVELLSPVSAAPAAIEITSGDGTALFRDVGPGPYHIQVLAPGFAAQTADTSSAHADVLTVKLRLAPAAECNKPSF